MRKGYIPMSITKNNAEGTRWFRQAENDLCAARALRESKFYAQACHLCQQSAEKYIKGAIVMLHGEAPRSHNLFDLMRAFTADGGDICADVKKLDRLYVTTRYPNAIDGEAVPFETVDASDTEEALLLAEEAKDAVLSWALRQGMLFAGREEEGIGVKQDYAMESIIRAWSKDHPE
jgi:HEPN domain-containing protein